MRWQKNFAADVSGQLKDFVVHLHCKYIFPVMKTGFPYTQIFTEKFIAGNSLSVTVAQWLKALKEGVSKSGKY